MAWVFTLPNGSKLRELIENEDHKAVLEEIITSYKLIASHFEEDEEDIYEIDSINDDIECEAFDEDSVNYHLEGLYDYCDSRRVWVEL